MHINIQCFSRHSDIHQHIINSGDQLLEAGYILPLYVRLYAYLWASNRYNQQDARNYYGGGTVYGSDFYNSHANGAIYAYPWCITIRTYPGSTIFLDGERENLTALQIFRIIGCKAMQMHRIIGVLYVRILLVLVIIMVITLI